MTETLTGLLGIRVPVIQAPIGTATTPELAAAVSGFGGLGMLALTWHAVDAARAEIRQVQAATDRPFGVNFVLDFAIDHLLEAALEEGVPIISTFWGDPAAVHPTIAAAGRLHLHVVGSVTEARYARDCGVDVIVAQGWEAGGHVRGTSSTMTLVPAVVDEVAPVPVVAAGGIADGRGLVAALALGASGVWMGTRFLAATEAKSHESFRQALVRATVDDTTWTSCFDEGWPNAPHRVLRNKTLEAWERAGRPNSPYRPGESDILAWTADGQAHRRYGDQVPLLGMHGEVTELAMYAGQSTGLITKPSTSAAAILDSLLDQARRARAAFDLLGGPPCETS